MEVKIIFDTEKESVDELKKLIANLQQIVDKRENRQSYSSEQPLPIQQPQNMVRQKTSGGCEIIPFQNMNKTMEKIFSGKN